jgi:exosortase A
MDEGTRRHRRLLVAVLAACLTLLAWLHRDTLYAIGEKWYSDAAFSHGLLILPIAVWLAWRRRADLACVPWAPSWAGVALLGACTAAWVLARGSGVLVAQQFAVVAMIPALVLAVLGGPAARVLGFALAFTLLAVPFGRGIVPQLMQVTADIATVLLRWTGVPVLRSNMYIEIPAGSFEVARACSGLNYFVTGLVLGVLYAHLTYRKLWKRLLCVAAFVVIPILLNGLRVYFTILAGHLTDMRFGPGDEHITFGRIFFVAMILLMFWVGRRWHDPAPQPVAEGLPAASAPDAPDRRGGWLPLVAAVAMIAVGPPLLERLESRSRAAVAETASLVAVPDGRDGWSGPREAPGSWRPFYSGGLIERQVAYRDADGGIVDVFVSVYGIGATAGAEMISYNNVVFHGEFVSLLHDQRWNVPAGAADPLAVREMLIRSAGGERLVWQWFMVGDRPAVHPAAVKLLEVAAFFGGTAKSERIVTLSTAADDGARERLASFVAAHPECVRSGFVAADCGT